MAGQSHYTPQRPEFDTAPRVAVVVAPYYREIADQLLSGACAELDAAGAKHEVIEVPGALEVPIAIQIAGRRNDFDGFLALGCVIRGETTHYDTVCNDSSRALTLLGLEGFCIGNGILTVENMSQAEIRADPGAQNKGGGAAAAALHLIALTWRFSQTGKTIGFRPGETRLAGDARGSETA